MTVPNLSLNDSTTIPQFGFGVWQVAPAQCQAVVETALEAGYRHIDTAQMYGNEAEVGAAVAGLPREEVYLTTKLNNGNHEPARAKESLAESLTALGTDHVDLFLIHWPLPGRYAGDFVSTWQALIELQAEGLTTSIGVSNFEPGHLAALVDHTGVTPAVKQIELHPYFGNRETAAATLAIGGLVQAWSPLGQGGGELADPVLVALAEKYDRTTAQIALRWQIDQGNIVFPKSSTPSRIAENIDIFDFSLTRAEVEEINALDRGEAGRTGPNPLEFNWIPGQ